MKIALRPQSITRLLILATVTLIFLSTAGQFLQYILGFDSKHVKRVYSLFYVDLENNIPAWFSSSLLLMCCVLLALTAIMKRRISAPFFPHWAGLSVLFLLFSIEESVAVHEQINTALKVWLRTGAFYFPWVILGAVFALIVASTYLRFLQHLPAETRRFFLLAGVLFVGGAVGVEILGGIYVIRHGPRNFPYAMISAAEELLEMLGIIVFLHALMSHLRAEETCFSFANPTPAVTGDGP